MPLDIDRCAEEPYRRLMAIYSEQGRMDAVVGTWGSSGPGWPRSASEMEGASVALYRSLTVTPVSSTDIAAASARVEAAAALAV